MTIHPPDRVAVFHFSGKVNVPLARAAFVDYTARPDFDPAHTMLSDATQTTEVEARFVDVMTNVLGLMSILRRFETPVVSVVIVADDTAFGFVRMLGQALDFTSNISMRPVWSRAEAATATGLPLARLDHLLDVTVP